MSFSVITPVKNVGGEIFDTIKSVNSQIGVEVEHIIVNGESNDDLSILLAQDPNINSKVMCLGDQGIYDAFNKGLQVGNGQIISFLGSGDVFGSDTTLLAVENCFESDQIDAVYGNIILKFESGKMRFRRLWQAGEFSKLNLFFGWMPPHPTFFVKKKTFSTIGKFDTTLAISGDYDFVLRFFLNQEMKTKYLDQTLVLMRGGGASTKFGTNLFRKLSEDISVASRYYSLGFLTVFFKLVRKTAQFRI